MSEPPPAWGRRRPYFQLPLSAFAYGASPEDRLGAIICYGIFQIGMNRVRSSTPQEIARRIKAARQAGQLSDAFQLGDCYQNAIACGVAAAGCTFQGPEVIMMGNTLIHGFHEEFERRYGPEPLVRLRTDLVFEARYGRGITPEELAVLAGIYSVIGNKRTPVHITQNRIRCRALGYKSLEVMKNALPNRKDNAKPMTQWRLRAMLDRLQARKFFVRATYGQRQSYYSHRMTDEQLRAAVVDLKLKRSARETAQWARHRQDEAMTAAIRECREKLDRKQLPSRPGPVEANG